MIKNKTKALLVLLMVIFAAGLIPFGADSEVSARRKKKDRKMAGELKELVYTDSEFGFSLSLLEDWSIKIHEHDDPLRLVAQKDNYTVPPEFKGSELYTTIPTFKVIIDTTSLDLLDFIDSLKSSSYDSEQKKNLTRELKVLDGQFTRPRVSRLRLENGVKGRLFKTALDYSINVQKPGENTATPVQDQIRGDIAFFKGSDKKTLYILCCVCESQYYDMNKPLFDLMIKSFSFTDDKS